MSQQALHYLPSSHISSLRRLEREYWWCIGRVNWAKAAIQSRFKGEPIGTYADVGCGTGIFAEKIRDEFQPYRNFLVDGDASLPQRTHGFECLVQNFDEGIEFPTPADLITCMDVIEHIEDDTQMLRRLHQNLKQDGILILSVPAVPYFFSDWDRKLGHHRRYLKSQLKKLVNRTGFEVVECQYMWSFLAPMGPIRKYQKHEEATEFPKTAPWLNALFIRLSAIERMITRAIPTPIGTSLFLVARRN